MLSVRNAILAAAAIFVLALIGGILSLLRPPDSNGRGTDSYGTRGDGYRGVYELLSAVDASVQRCMNPPSPDIPVSSTIVLWMPNRELIANEPKYLTSLLPWIEQGGRIVVAPVPLHRLTIASRFQASQRIDGKDIWQIFELDGVHQVPAASTVTRTEREAIAPKPRSIRDARRDQIRRGLQQAFEESYGHSQPIEFSTLQVKATGTFAALATRVQELTLPIDQLSELSLDDLNGASGLIKVSGPAGEDWTLAAAFRRGLGEIVVVGEPAILMNVVLGQSDNAVLGHDLLAARPGDVVFDEFYHGLSVRGNPLWLLTQKGYGMVTLAMLVLIALDLWRRAVLLGPRLDIPSKSRRTIIEYIEAVSRFLYQGRASRPFLLNELRLGALRHIGERLNLSHGVHEPEVIASALARRAPRQADEFREAMRLLDAALKRGRACSESEAVRAMQRISCCL